MTGIVFLIILLIVGWYFAIRYFSIIFSIREIRKELEEILGNLHSDSTLHLPSPDRHLEKLLRAFNRVLEERKRERIDHERRDRQFREQIENISHDIRTPLTVILGYLKLIRKNGGYNAGRSWTPEEAGELKDALDILEQKAESMRQLTEQFYDYSRLAGDDYKMEMAVTDVSRVLRESLLGNYQVMEHSRINVTADILEHPLMVWGNAAGMERIFQNLFQNAARYAASEFRLKLSETEDCAVIQFINDTDILSESDMPYLFERFYMQDKSRGTEGTGLGLTVAKALAEQMGGTLEAQMRQEGERKEVCFELRLALNKYNFEPAERS